jgi:hypothetical protein
MKIFDVEKPSTGRAKFWREVAAEISYWDLANMENDHWPLRIFILLFSPNLSYYTM